MKQHFALELYSVRNDLTNDFEDTLKAVKAMGYEAVEFAGDYVHSAEKLRQPSTKSVCNAAAGTRRGPMCRTTSWMPPLRTTKPSATAM